MNVAVFEACRRVGTQAALARALAVKPSTVNEWCLDESRVPVGRCVDIERITGIPCEALRPDLVEFFTYLRTHPIPVAEGLGA
ncbi:MAG: Cro/Cl family transcriptional regulator [Variovorax paradoxus]|nr:MAG: Cro/Cl family transcriptional regulator [Variovorax paradoxus]PZQ08957.1 MAG: Cro/Cl family transcriptional regulator [Variovorax paradoxus]